MRYTIYVSLWISNCLVELFSYFLIHMLKWPFNSILWHECTKPNQCYFHIHIFHNKNTTSNVVSCEYSWEFRIIEGYSYSTFNVKMVQSIGRVFACGVWYILLVTCVLTSSKKLLSKLCELLFSSVLKSKTIVHLNTNSLNFIAFLSC